MRPRGPLSPLAVLDGALRISFVAVLIAATRLGQGKVTAHAAHLGLREDGALSQLLASSARGGARAPFGPGRHTAGMHAHAAGVRVALHGLPQRPIAAGAPVLRRDDHLAMPHGLPTVACLVAQSPPAPLGHLAVDRLFRDVLAGSGLGQRLTAGLARALGRRDDDAASHLLLPVDARRPLGPIAQHAVGALHGRARVLAASTFLLHRAVAWAATVLRPGDDGAQAGLLAASALLRALAPLHIDGHLAVHGHQAVAAAGRRLRQLAVAARTAIHRRLRDGPRAVLLTGHARAALTP
mmetsp:Transcript_77965/g.200723  ORF Transcript_77965/g.200723 Transcript_77965/m.200723 type:complete len:296 (+) Transcript_77965:873-1760(+)